jgi:4-amino-4-deoxychorismate lyase
MLSRKGQVQLLNLHVKRLINDATKLKIINSKVRFSASDLKNLIKTIAIDSYSEATDPLGPRAIETGAQQTGSLQTGSLQTGSLQTGSLQTGFLQTEWQIVKLLIARGDSERGYAPALDSEPVFIPTVKNYYPTANQTLRLGLAKMTLAEQSMLSGIKHLNRLEQVMAKIELAECEGVDDLILTNASGMVIELTSSNIFYCIDGIWHTPCVEKSGVNGVMRQYILDYMQRHQMAYNVCEMHVSALLSAQTAFSCNAITQLIPISEVSIGNEYFRYDMLPSHRLARTISDEIAKEKS